MSHHFDVVAYGGTAGGVISALTAARQGLRVALLEPGKHLGGMVTGGLITRFRLARQARH
jgi:pyruvate/2-oxoglutarate dehydrogenase complex dihydrolipoamide dehydrogenase (E3) component